MFNFIHTVSFYFFALLSVLTALVVVSGKNLFHNVLSLGLFLFSIAGLYFHLNTHFLGAIQILLYVGGVIVLALFGIMLTPGIADPQEKQTNEQRGLALIITIGLGGTFIFALGATFLSFKSIFPQTIEIASFGRLLFRDYTLAVELLGLIFLSAIIGVVILTGEEQSRR